MNLRQLEVFHAVMITGTTVAAGRRLGISQPAVSNMVRHIESSMGLELFERRFGRLEPTQDALDLHAEVLPLFDFYRAVDRKVRDIRDGRIGSIRVVATSSPANSVIPLAIKAFQIKHPMVQISFNTLRVEEVIDHVSYNVADLGLTLNTSETRPVMLERLATRPMSVVIPKGHALARKSEITVKELAEYPLISMEEGTPLGDKIKKIYENAGIRPASSVETGFFASVCSMVHAGVGCGIVDGFTAGAGNWSGIEVRPFKPDTNSVLEAVLPRQRPVPKLVKTFLSEVRKISQTA